MLPLNAEQTSNLAALSTQAILHRDTKISLINNSLLQDVLFLSEKSTKLQHSSQHIWHQICHYKPYLGGNCHLPRSNWIN